MCVWCLGLQAFQLINCIKHRKVKQITAKYFLSWLHLEMKSDSKKELDSKPGTGKINMEINSFQFPSTGWHPSKGASTEEEFIFKIWASRGSKVWHFFLSALSPITSIIDWEVLRKEGEHRRNPRLLVEIWEKGPQRRHLKLVYKRSEGTPPGRQKAGSKQRKSLVQKYTGKHWMNSKQHGVERKSGEGGYGGSKVCQTWRRQTGEKEQCVWTMANTSMWVTLKCRKEL